MEEGIYQHGYESIVKLHSLNELEQIQGVIGELLLKPNDHKASESVIRKLSTEWGLRIKVNSFRTIKRDLIKVLFKIGSARID